MLQLTKCKLAIVFSVTLTCSSCNRLVDNIAFKSSYGDELIQDNDSLYAKLDTDDELNLKYLKHLIDKAQFEMTISSLQKAERNVLSKRVNNVKK
jgi:hypothetical protein